MFLDQYSFFYIFLNTQLKIDYENYNNIIISNNKDNVYKNIISQVLTSIFLK